MTYRDPHTITVSRYAVFRKMPEGLAFSSKYTAMTESFGVYLE